MMSENQQYFLHARRECIKEIAPETWESIRNIVTGDPSSYGVIETASSNIGRAGITLVGLSAILGLHHKISNPGIFLDEEHIREAVQELRAAGLNIEYKNYLRERLLKQGIKEEDLTQIERDQYSRGDNHVLRIELGYEQACELLKAYTYMSTAQRNLLKNQHAQLMPAECDSILNTVASMHCPPVGVQDPAADTTSQVETLLALALLRRELIPNPPKSLADKEYIPCVVKQLTPKTKARLAEAIRKQFENPDAAPEQEQANEIIGIANEELKLRIEEKQKRGIARG